MGSGLPFALVRGVIQDLAAGALAPDMANEGGDPGGVRFGVSGRGRLSV